MGFVIPIGEWTVSEVFIKSIIDMVKNLNDEVFAEDVETRKQVAF